MPALRITGGSLRGRRVAIPPGEVRPTSERARQAYFNIVSDRVNGATFLDLFAGSGIFSFEALSRGAASATAVDRDTKSIEKTAKELGLTVNTIAGDALVTAARCPLTADLVYADPPYDYDRYDDLLAALDEHQAGALVTIEHRKRSTPFTITPQRLRETDRREYGEVWMTFFES